MIMNFFGVTTSQNVFHSILQCNFQAGDEGFKLGKMAGVCRVMIKALTQMPKVMLERRGCQNCLDGGLPCLILMRRTKKMKKVWIDM